MTQVGLEHYLVVSGLLFCLGLWGVIVRRNLLIIYMSLELMLNAANLALVAFSRFNNKLDGQIMVFFIITVAAAALSYQFVEQPIRRHGFRAAWATFTGWFRGARHAFVAGIWVVVLVLAGGVGTVAAIASSDRCDLPAFHTLT